METGALKEEEKRLKWNIIANLEIQFVDEFQRWREKVDMFNEVIMEYNKMNRKRLRLMTYDEFCSLFVKGSKTILNDHIRMENIVPNGDEVEVLRTTMDDPEDADTFKKKYAALLEAKYANVKRKLAQVWDGQVFRSIVVQRYGVHHFDGILAARTEVMSKMDRT